MVTYHFLKQFLRGEKKLLKYDELRGTDKIPRFPELSVQSIWNEVKDKPDINVYFPDNCVSKCKLPDRTYMFRVI